MLRIFERALRYRFWKLVRIRASPHEVSLGLAIGIFCGALPIMGVQSVVAVPLAFLCRSSVTASLIGVWWTNPVTFIPIYYSEYLVGGALFSNQLLSYGEFYSRFAQIQDLDGVLSLGGDIFRPMAYGSFVIGPVLGLIGYFSLYKALEARKRRKEKRREEMSKRVGQ